MKNITISKRLVTLSATIAGCALAIAALMCVSLILLGVHTNKLSGDYWEASNYAAEIRTTLNVTAKDIRDMLILGNSSNYNSYKAKIEADYAEMDHDIIALGELYTGSASSYAEYDTLLQSWQAAASVIMEHIMAGDTVTAAHLLETECLPTLDLISIKADEINNETNSAVDEEMALINTITSTCFWLLVVISIFGTVVTIIVSRKTRFAIVHPIEEIRAAADKIKEGELSTKISYESSDELGQLADSLREMMSSISTYVYDIEACMNKFAEGDLNFVPGTEPKGDFVRLAVSVTGAMEAVNATIIQIAHASDEVSSGSVQLAAGAQALSQGSTEQASAVEELAATITNISEQVQQNAEDSVVANDRVLEVSKVLNESATVMSEMIEAMNDISKSSADIAKIIKTIEDIAFQTNLLALNAAVEAARAGAAGKGFSVVADEVRNLASKSSVASKDTADLIDSSLKAVERGVKLAGITSDSLLGVVTSAEEVTVSIDKISVSSTEQASAISQILIGIDQISSVVQTNSATAEESAAASEELSGQSSVLKNLVNQFKTKGGSSSSDDFSSFSPNFSDDFSFSPNDKY